METEGTGPASLIMPVEEVAARLGVGRARVYQLAAEGAIPHTRRGRAVIFWRSAWDEWMRQKSDEATANCAGWGERPS